MTNPEKQINSALVTGGAGFIGSHLTAALVAGGCKVTVLDNLATGYWKNLDGCRDRITCVDGDIRDEKVLAGAAAGCEFVFHLAAEVSVPRTVETPLESAAINDMGTLKVLEAARHVGAKKVILSSSCAVYGDPARMPIAENTPARPLSPYAVQKLAGEHYAAVYSRLYGLEAVSLRYFNVYGPRQDPSLPYSGVISIFLNRAEKGARPVIYGDGEQSRDFIYVADVVEANLRAAQQTGVAGQVFNIGTSRSTTINQLWDEISGLSGIGQTPEYLHARDGDIFTSLADTTLANEKLGFKAKTPLEAGLAETYRWYARKG